PSLLLIGHHARVVLPVADRPAVRCDRVPFAAGAPPSSIIGPDYPPPTRRIPQLRKWAVDGGIPLRECCPLAYADGLLRGSWVFSPVGSGHLAPRLLVPFPGAPRIGMPREEHRVEAVFASHGLIPEAVEQGPGPHGAKADNLSASGPVDRRQGGGPNLFSPRVERPFVEDQEVRGQRPARIPGGGQCPEDGRLPARVLDGECQGGVGPDRPGVPCRRFPAVADHP